mmetsp:Transcript_638/g.1928  ORF Transcript_638/g.1928 Transcript_638/m.1928 type:complete len:255 (-) Transcript_638:188-952(-)
MTSAKVGLASSAGISEPFHSRCLNEAALSALSDDVPARATHDPAIAVSERSRETERTPSELSTPVAHALRGARAVRLALILRISADVYSWTNSTSMPCACPKSSSLISIAEPVTSEPRAMMLAGVMSRCTTPCACMCSTAEASCAAMERTTSTGSAPWLSSAVCKSHPSQSSSTVSHVGDPAFGSSPSSGTNASITETMCGCESRQRASSSRRAARAYASRSDPRASGGTVTTLTATRVPLPMCTAAWTSPKAP